MLVLLSKCELVLVFLLSRGYLLVNPLFPLELNLGVILELYTALVLLLVKP